MSAMRRTIFEPFLRQGLDLLGMGRIGDIEILDSPENGRPSAGPV